MKTTFAICLILLKGLIPVLAQDNAKSGKTERVYLHTDRNIYVTGEYLFYTFYLQGNPDQMSKFAYVVIRDQHSSSIATMRLEINNQTSYGSMYLPDTLHTGMYQIIGYTNFMRNESEETYFTKEILILNRYDKTVNLFAGSDQATALISPSSAGMKAEYPDSNLEIQLNKKHYHLRDKIEFTVTPKNIPENDVMYLSVSISEVFPALPFDPPVSTFFNRAGTASSGTSGKDTCRFIPEFSGVVLQGKVVPKQRYNLYISSPDSFPNMQYTITDSSGSFSLLLNRFYDGKEVILRIQDNPDASLQPDDKFHLGIPYRPSGLFYRTGIQDYLKRNISIVQASKVYGGQIAPVSCRIFPPAITAPRVYYKPTYTIFPQDYVELEDFLEISRELVPALKIRKNGDLYTSAFINMENPSALVPEPQFFLNGVPIENVNQIISLGTSSIHRIETLPMLRFYGNQVFNGILAVFGPQQKINDILYRIPAVRIQAPFSQPYTKPRPFRPESVGKRSPDLRQLLLWEPKLTIGGNETRLIECYASDLQGVFHITIQGITASGKTVYASEVFMVQAKSR